MSKTMDPSPRTREMKSALVGLANGCRKEETMVVTVLGIIGWEEGRNENDYHFSDMLLSCRDGLVDAG